ncbi:MAG: hydroxymethylpyrimidine/phosphomethylpyrimidine kinase, partial [Sphingomonadales bacterium]|nr:hydroxymethylpyrimidine/phosphomethylpyrimidine kinase [Sphingomonadales bacterium]
ERGNRRFVGEDGTAGGHHHRIEHDRHRQMLEPVGDRMRGLGRGFSIEKAFEQAVSFVRIAIVEAPGLGEGHGPLGQQYVTDFQWGERDKD